MTVQENVNKIKEDIQEICQRIGRNQSEIHIIAVTKYVSIETTAEALDAGIQHFGENRIEGALEKWEAFQPEGTWHFIGTLQTRKVKEIAGKYDYVHSLERLSLAKELDKRMPEGKVMKCFVQVNVSGEESKSGLHSNEVETFIEQLAENNGIEVVGLMTMAPNVEDPELTRPIFRKLREIQQRVQQKKWPHAPCHELSMGMSNDYKVALEEGATFIRIGSALVGKG
ncbi:YggS family pyridoxal phosphate-dependent enzyme [Bacillus sp. JCM 19034]|uniref:YggS family pyridoxal phosphate-dependent enzyme n=1 Tax=Bacillus sp. JCM 19034 TaxID=1481928 RepID=UPI000783A2CB|nr:YggS family pyridoxal phosphate-dependent enzyme [Bacillus sp. JCM 19034]